MESLEAATVVASVNNYRPTPFIMKHAEPVMRGVWPE